MRRLGLGLALLVLADGSAQPAGTARLEDVVIVWTDEACPPDFPVATDRTGRDMRVCRRATEAGER